MILNSKVLQRLPVRTKSGEALGKVVSFDVDALTGTLTMLHVSTHRSLVALLQPELLISRMQIVEMNDREIIVQDGLVQAPASLAMNVAKNA